MKDRTLLDHFSEATKHLQLLQLQTDTVQEVHTMLLSKIYNARSNEFLRGVSKVQCIKSNKGVDVNIGLRDKLKCYAAEKRTLTTE